MKRNLKLAYERPPEKVFGSSSFINLTRNTGLKSPKRFEPTEKGAEDVVI